MPTRDDIVDFHDPPVIGSATQLRGVLFDLDDTLLDHRSAASSAALGLAHTFGLDEPDEMLVATWHRLTDSYYPRYQARELSYGEQTRARVRDFLRASDLTDDEADTAFAEYRRRYRARWRAYDDAAPALRRCRAAGLAVGVLTNGEAEIQTAKLEATGLLNLVDMVAASSELSAAKPDPRAFTEAVARLGLRVGEVAMVGDSVTNDVRGALGAGLSAVLLDRYGAGTPPADLTTLTVYHSLEELP